jgi:hypothetical protein
MALSLQDLERMQDEVRALRRQSRQNLQMFEDMLRQRGVDVEAELARFLALPAATQKAALAEFSGQLTDHPLWGLSPVDLPQVDGLPTAVAASDQDRTSGASASGLDQAGLRRSLQRLTTQRI